MTRNNILLPTVFGVLVIVALLCFFTFRSVKPLKLPGMISTVTAGYPYAARLKDAVAADAYLSGVIVDLDCVSNAFQTRTITYGFRLADKNRTILVMLDNASRTAYPVEAEDPKQFFVPASAFQKLDLSKISKDIPDILEIARPAGLSEFCKIVPPDGRNIDLRLGGGVSGATWSVVGDGWDQKGPIAFLSIEINSTTGTVTKQSLQKGAGRP